MDGAAHLFGVATQKPRPLRPGFTRYFYKPKPMRALEEIRADILALEQETEGLLGEIIGGTTR